MHYCCVHTGRLKPDDPKIVDTVRVDTRLELQVTAVKNE